MVRLLRVLPLAVLLVAAIESVFIRVNLPHRPVDWALFLQAAVLWTVGALLVLLPATLTLRLIHRDEEKPAPVFAVLLGWMVLPLVAHALLDRHTGLATDMAGRLAGLKSVWPWLELVAAVAVGALVLRLLARPLSRVSSGGASFGFALILVLVGGYVPLRSAPSGSGASDKPNLLLLIWDTCRQDRLDVYGYERETAPELAKLADQSLVFEEARSVSVFTFSSHLSMLTGVYPSAHGGRLLSTRYDPRRAEHLAAMLRSAGYRTGAFVGTDVLAGRTGIRFGFEEYDDRVDPPVCDTRGWKVVHDVQSLLAGRFPAFKNNGRPHWFQDFQRPASEVLEHALAWIENDDPRPWFCFVNLYDVHWPYLPEGDGHERLVREYDGPLDGFLFRSDRWQKGYEIQPEDQRHVTDLYEAEIYELDQRVSAFLGELGLERGNTAVLMTSDHGEAFGEAGRWKHEDIIEPQVRIPLLLRLPEANPEGQRVAGYASGVDVAPTLLALAGVEPDEPMHGRDLAQPIEPEREILVEDRDHVDPTDVRVALYSKGFKLVRLGLEDDVEFALYDLSQDENGEHDVSADHPELFAQLRERLQELRVEADKADGEVGESMGASLDGLEALGYMQSEEAEGQ